MRKPGDVKVLYRVKGHDVDFSIQTLMVVGQQDTIWVVRKKGDPKSKLGKYFGERIRKSSPNVFTDKSQAEKYLKTCQFDALQSLKRERGELGTRIEKLTEIIRDWGHSQLP